MDGRWLVVVWLAGVCLCLMDRIHWLHGKCQMDGVLMVDGWLLFVGWCWFVLDGWLKNW